MVEHLLQRPGVVVNSGCVRAAPGRAVRHACAAWHACAVWGGRTGELVKVGVHPVADGRPLVLLDRDRDGRLVLAPVALVV